jgi:phosphatidylglycerophosphatase A
MNITRLCTLIATLGPVGYFGAPGTVATILTLPLVYWLHVFFADQRIYLGIIIFLYFIGIAIVNGTLRQMRRHDDPSEIVFDEIVGCVVVFWGITLTTQSMIIGCVLFRALDIIKFGWIKKAESWTHAWGVMGDDLIAALISNIILRILFYAY